MVVTGTVAAGWMLLSPFVVPLLTAWLGTMEKLSQEPSLRQAILHAGNFSLVVVSMVGVLAAVPAFLIVRKRRLVIVSALNTLESLRLRDVRDIEPGAKGIVVRMSNGLTRIFRSIEKEKFVGELRLRHRAAQRRRHT